METLLQIIDITLQWCNKNSGFLTLIIFFASLFLGWISGIFKNLRHKPKFIFYLLQGPTFCCTFKTNRKYKNYDTTRTAIALYLKIKNVGSAPSEISKIQVGFHNYTFKYSFLWFWLNTTLSLKDFGHTIGENLRLFPFLIQKSTLLPKEKSTYLRNGESTQGVVYFEGQESWGSFIPRIKKNKVKIKLKIFDIYGNVYTKTFWIPNVDINYAKKFNENFGESIEELEKNKLENWKVF